MLRTSSQMPFKQESKLFSFIIGVAIGFLFIFFSISFHGSDKCIILKKNSIIYGIIQLIDCFLMLVEEIFIGSTNVCVVGCLSFFKINCYIAEFIYYIIVLVNLFDYEDCGDLRTFVLVYYISSLVVFSLLLVILIIALFAIALGFTTLNQLQNQR